MKIKITQPDTPAASHRVNVRVGDFVGHVGRGESVTVEAKAPCMIEAECGIYSARIGADKERDREIIIRWRTDRPGMTLELRLQ